MERVLDRELWWPSGEGLLLAAASSRAMLHDQSGDLRRFCPYIPACPMRRRTSASVLV